jgi:hypothetical protein
MKLENNYDFTNQWFEQTKAVWDYLIPKFRPLKILEIGSFEGRSICYVIEKLAGMPDLEIHCVDTWTGGAEHQADGPASYDMQSVEQRFHHNVQVAIDRSKSKINIKIHKGCSDLVLSKLIADGNADYFDLIYVDGSHQAPDVLSDAVMGFKLLKKNGIIIFDDYLWGDNRAADFDVLNCPKIAIDSFVNIYYKKLKILRLPLYQLYLQKI